MSDVFPGTGPQALVDLFSTEWQASRTGRPDIPPAVEDPKTEFGVRIVHDRSTVNQQRAVHDLVHCYHPSADPISIEDKGFKEVEQVETVQVDIECSDRTDPETGERLFARERMVGSREDETDLAGAGFTLGGASGATLGGDDGGTLGTQNDAVAYPGLLGEVLYILELVRRGYEEWDVVRSPRVVGATLKNSSARMSLDVQLEHTARNTVV